MNGTLARICFPNEAITQLAPRGIFAPASDNSAQSEELEVLFLTKLGFHSRELDTRPSSGDISQSCATLKVGVDPARN